MAKFLARFFQKSALFANIGHCPSFLDDALMGICGMKSHLLLIVIVND